MSDTGSELLDRLVARRARIRDEWSKPPQQKPVVFLPLPVQHPKHVDERIAEAEDVCSDLPRYRVKDIIEAIRESANDFGETCSLDVVKTDLPPETPRNRSPTMNVIQEIVAKHFGITRDNILCKRRFHRFSKPRQISIYLAKVLTKRSFSDIAHRTGGLDHTTAIHAFHKIERLAETDAALAADIAALKERMLQ